MKTGQVTLDQSSVGGATSGGATSFKGNRFMNIQKQSVIVNEQRSENNCRSNVPVPIPNGIINAN
jgi:hypothetical protein